MSKIAAHPVLRGQRPTGRVRRGRRALADAGRRGLILELVRQNVGVAILAAVEKAARVGEKVKRPEGRRAQGEWPLALGTHPGTGPVKLRNQRQPATHLIVAQAARSFLQVRLKVKDGAAVFLVPPPRHLEKIPNQVPSVAGHQLRNGVVAEPRE